MNNIKVMLGEGEVLLDSLLRRGVPIAHDCDGTLACAACRVIVREGLNALEPAGEDERDMLDRACVTQPEARLACQVTGAGELLLDIPPGEAPPLHAGTRTLPLSVTPRAARFLASQLARHPGAAGVRLAVAPAGCSGFGYRLEHAGEIRDADVVFESEGLRVAVDAASLPHVAGTTVDLVQEGLARRLRFDNPNARERCGCGESFRT
jgi:iron-sulfur cluster assembly protein